METDFACQNIVIVRSCTVSGLASDLNFWENIKTSPEKNSYAKRDILGVKVSKIAVQNHYDANFFFSKVSAYS